MSADALLLIDHAERDLRRFELFLLVYAIAASAALFAVAAGVST